MWGADPMSSCVGGLGIVKLGASSIEHRLVPDRRRMIEASPGGLQNY